MRDVHVFLNGDRGLPVLDALCMDGHGVESIIVPANKTVKGLAEIAQRHGVRIWPVADVNAPDFIAEMRVASPELFIIAGYSTIFRRPIYSLPRLGTINLHGGRLPEYRGGSPLNWQIINGENEAGISVIRVDDGIDSGPILAEGRIAIGASDTIATVHAAANRQFPSLVLESIASLERDPGAGRVQDESHACYWHQRNDEDGRIDPSRQTAKQIDRQVRALTRPYPGAYALLDGRRIRILQASIPDFRLAGVAGRVCRVQGMGPFLICADHALLIEEYIIEDSQGAQLRHGDRLS